MNKDYLISIPLAFAFSGPKAGLATLSMYLEKADFGKATVLARSLSRRIDKCLGFDDSLSKENASESLG